MTETTATNYLGRCKDCDYALFATAESIQQADNATAGGPAVNIGNGQIMGRCKSGHRWFALRRVKGTYSDKHTCDSRCLNAKGHDCTCSCGGANHGRGYAVAVTTVEAGQPNVDARVADAPAPAQVTPVKLPEVGDTFTATLRCTYVRHDVGQYGSTMFLFSTSKGTTVKWFAPDYLGNFCEKGDDVRITAIVKDVREWQGNPEVIVKNVEKVEA